MLKWHIDTNPIDELKFDSIKILDECKKNILS